MSCRGRLGLGAGRRHWRQDFRSDPVELLRSRNDPRLAASVAVNRYCLVDDLPAAEALAVRFSLEEPEPGDYFVLRVRRRMG